MAVLRGRGRSTIEARDRRVATSGGSAEGTCRARRERASRRRSTSKHYAVEAAAGGLVACRERYVAREPSRVIAT
jgi:hypothetical protein